MSVGCFVQLDTGPNAEARPMILPADLHRHDRGSLAADLLADYECRPSTAGLELFAAFKVKCAAELGRAGADPTKITLQDIDGCVILDFEDISSGDTLVVTFEAAEQTCAPDTAPAAAPAAPESDAQSRQHAASAPRLQPGTSATRFQGHLAVGKLVRAAFTDANFCSTRALGIIVSGDANRQEPLYVLCKDFAPDRGTGVYKFNVTRAGALKPAKPGSQGTYRAQLQRPEPVTPTLTRR